MNWWQRFVNWNRTYTVGRFGWRGGLAWLVCILLFGLTAVVLYGRFPSSGRLIGMVAMGALALALGIVSERSGGPLLLVYVFLAVSVAFFFNGQRLWGQVGAWALRRPGGAVLAIVLPAAGFFSELRRAPVVFAVDSVVRWRYATWTSRADPSARGI